MRYTRHTALMILLALGAGGCGELQNAPFRVGTVHGQLAESTPALAMVSVLGEPHLRSAVAPDGTFLLEDVPAGQAELFIIASENKALRLALTIPGGQSVSLGLVEPKAASFLDLRVKAPSHERVNDARVSLVGTPLGELQLSESGRLELGPLPDGCYTLALSFSSFPEVSTEACVSTGETKEVKVNLPPPSSGCMVTGCSDGFQCLPEGRCVECLEDIHCGPGLTCHNLRCEGEGMLCTPCAGDWSCKVGSRCLELPEGVSACVEECDDSDDCEDGFQCRQGQCLPDEAQFAGCGGYRQMGSACDRDERCRERGLLNGACVQRACTFRCGNDRQCPPGYSCQNTEMGRVCQPD